MTSLLSSTSHGCWRTGASLMAADLTALMIAILLALVVRTWVLSGIGNSSVPVSRYLGLMPLVLPVFLACYAALHLYGRLAHTPAEELRRLTWGTTTGFMALAGAAFIGGPEGNWSRGVFVLAWLFALLIVPLGRGLARMLLAQTSWWGQPVVVLGAGLTGALVIRHLRDHPGLGLRPLAAFDDDPSKHGSLEGVPVPGPLDAAPDFARQHGICSAIVAMPGADPRRLLELDETQGDTFPHLLLIPPLVGWRSLWMEAKDLGGALALEARRNLLLPGPQRLKRVMDLGLTGLLLLILGPLVMLPIAMLVRMTSPGPAFFRHTVLGRGGNTFRIWKFRSMVSDADRVLAELLAKDPAAAEEFRIYRKLRHDPRVTWIGRFLRKTSLDELPQLFNVLSGDMSLVGPRPIVDEEAPVYARCHALHLYHRVRPGITGPWQVLGRSEITLEERAAIVAYYVRNWSPWLDLHLLWCTVLVVLRARGAY